MEKKKGLEKCSNVIELDYIPVRFIGIYQSMLGISWGLGYVVGALVGKLF